MSTAIFHSNPICCHWHLKTCFLPFYLLMNILAHIHFIGQSVGWSITQMFQLTIWRPSSFLLPLLPFFILTSLLHSFYPSCLSSYIQVFFIPSTPLAFLHFNKSYINKAGYMANTSCRRVGWGGNACFPIFWLVLTDHRTDQRTDEQTLLYRCVSATKKFSKEI